jgi:SHS2 domain-containing protein
VTTHEVPAAGDPTRYEEFEHTADVGIRAFGDSLSEIFRNAAYGMFRILAGEREVAETLEREVVVDPVDDPELGLVRFLSELLTVADTEHLLFADLDVRIDGTTLTARCRGEQVGPDLGGLGIDIKAVTRHLLEVDVGSGRAVVLFDV